MLSMTSGGKQLTPNHEQRTTVKESSDELNPTVATPELIPTSPRKRSSKDYLALAIATCGVGYLPIAPGTWGSLLAVGFYLLLRRQWFALADLQPSFISRSFIFVQALIVVAVTTVGVWAASRTERVLRKKDPGKVVVDEVAGQLIALMAVPVSVANTLATWVIVAFMLFRTFDIVKPYPARKLEDMHGGLGIMADDLVAGLYAALCLLIMRVLSG